MREYNNPTNDGHLINEKGEVSFANVYGDVDVTSMDNLNMKQMKELRDNLTRKKNRLIAKKDKPITFYGISVGAAAAMYGLLSITMGNVPNEVVSMFPETMSFAGAVSGAMLTVTLPASVVLTFLAKRSNAKIDEEISWTENKLNDVKHRINELRLEKRNGNKIGIKYGNNRNDKIQSNQINDTNLSLIKK